MSQIEEAQAAIEREDYDAAIQLLRPFADSGFAEAQYLLGSLYFTSAEVDPRESHDWLRRAATQNHPTATYDLARWQDDTVFPPPTEDYYRFMLLRAAELGSVDAWSMLGRSYATGDGGFPRDAAIARQWYLRAAERGDAYAQYNYGAMLYDGEGGSTDPKASLNWIRKAAAGGESSAIHFLSQLPNEVA